MPAATSVGIIVAMLTLSWARTAAWRMHRQYLEKRAPVGSMLAVVSRLCGLHAQVMSCAELTAWARVEGVDRVAVQRALWEDRTLVKTWAMRGTLHLLRSDELPLWLAVLRTSRHYLKEELWKKYFGVTLEDLDRLTESIAVALDGRVMTREELVREVGRITGSATFASKLGESSWGTILKPAAFTGRLCFAPSLGPRVRFTHPDSWLTARVKSTEPQGATAEIVRRFLTAYGPATYHDLARWWGANVSTARQWISSLGEEIAPVKLEGAQAWVLASDVYEMHQFRPGRWARLLPGFDQYVVAASHHAEHLLPGDSLRPLVYRPQGWISPVLLVNGRIEGVWRYELRGSRMHVVISPFGEVPGWVRRTIEQEAERLAVFLDGTLSLVWND